MLARVNGIALYYEMVGQGEWLVLIHASADNSAIWFNQVPAFAKHYRVLTYDMRGFGRSDKPADLRRETLVEDLYALLETLEIKGAFFLGHSMGGGVAQRLAIEHPEIVKALILAGSGAGRPLSPLWAKFNRELADLLEREGMSAILGERMRRLFAPGFAERNPQGVRRYQEIRLMNDAAAYARSLRSSRNRAMSMEPERIHCPTLILLGDQDPLMKVEQAQALAKRIPKAWLKVLESCGHVSPLERPQEFNAAVLEFLAEVESGAPRLHQ